MYQALYRKWRPQTFDEVVGQKHITETLKNQVKTGRLSHAYLFIGTRGTGKTTCARILARAVNCEHPVDGNPCGRCSACRGILDGTILDVVELDAASNSGVDNVRALRDEAVYSPASVKKRVYIIDEVHMLSTAAFNALLKIIEEPPEHLMFILATTELHKVPATILSRCQRHSFKRIDTGEIAAHLQRVAAEERFDLTPDAAELIARLAEGGLRDALSLLDQCSASEHITVDAVYSAMGLAGRRRTAELFSLLLKHETAAALQSFSALWMDGKDPVTLLEELTRLSRDILMLQVAPKGGRELLNGGYDLATLRGFAEAMTKEELLAALDTLQAAQAAVKAGGDPRITAETCLVTLSDPRLSESLRALAARVSRLEAGAPPTAPKVEAPPVEQTAVAAPYKKEQPPLPDPAEEEVPAPTPVKTPEAPVGITWEALCERLKPRLPRNLSLSLGKSDTVQGSFEGEVLRLSVAPGFYYGQFNRQEVLRLFATAAEELRGRETRVTIQELKPQESKAGLRSLEELRQFPEVRFSGES